jgi:predicted nucleic-acid-binding protein
MSLESDGGNFIDTNTFIRYFTNDIPELAEKVERLIKRAKRGEIKLVANELIVAEVVWVLESAYEMKKNQIYSLLQAMFNTHNLEIPNSGILKDAAVIYNSKNIDFIELIRLPI